MPKSIQPKVKSALHEIWQAPTKEAANKAFNLFEDMFEDKYPKAVNNLRQDREELMAFYDFPAQHWQSIRTTNPIESTFANIRQRTKRAKGCLTDKGMLHMMFKFAECAQKNWRRLRGFDFLAKVINGVRFVDGVEETDKPKRKAS
jgi:transposase-like protein